MAPLKAIPIPSLFLVTFLLLIINSTICLSSGSGDNIRAYEECFKRMNLLQPPVAAAPSSSRKFGFFDQSELCRDLFRDAGISIQINGRLPWDYLAALCIVLRGDDKKVDEYLATNYPAYDSKKIKGGHICVILE